jgi:branched-chain amino acid transport system substrate-binding protein
MARDRRTTAAGSVAVLVLSLAACSGSGGPNEATTVVTTVAPTTTMAPDDGVLRIGALLPLSGPGADLGQSMVDGVQLAVEAVNDAGGVGGAPVELTIADEGDGPASASRGLEELLDADVDAVVGPASSLVALDLLLTLRRDALVTCSPSATALALDQFPDDDLFFRTVASDSLEADALARAIDQTGRSSVAIVYVEDAYGRPLTDALVAQLASRSLEVDALVPYPTDDADFSDEVADAVDAGAEVIAIIGDQAAGPRLLAAMLAASGDDSVPIVVNDALRGSATGAVLSQLKDVSLDRVVGVGVHATPDDEDFAAALQARFPDSTGLFATNAAECVDLFALAATSAESTRSRDVAGRMVSVAAGGQSCRSFAECLAALESNRNINYEGPSGGLHLSPAGEVTRATYDLFGFDALGRERVLGSIIVNAGTPGPSL